MENTSIRKSNTINTITKSLRNIQTVKTQIITHNKQVTTAQIQAHHQQTPTQNQNPSQTKHLSKQRY